LRKKYKNKDKIESKPQFEEYKKPTKNQLTSEIANPANDLEYVIFNNQYFNILDKTLAKQGRSVGIRLYDDCLLDSHCYSVLNTRFLAVVGKEWYIEPATQMLKDKKIAEFVSNVLYNTNFDFLRYKLLHSILYGYYCSEIIWKVDKNNNIVIDKFIDKHPIKFAFDADRNLRLLTKDNMIDGISIPDKKFLIMRFGSEDTPFGLPLGQSLFWLTYFKKTEIKFWLVFSERFGQPTILGSTPTGTTEPDRDRIQEVLNSVQTNTSIVLPEDIKIQLLEATRSGNATYQEFCDFVNREMSKEVLGQVLTTENTETGSYSLGRIQENVRQDILESDADLLDENLNSTLIKWIVDLNFSTDVYPKICTNTTPPTNMLEKSQIDKNLYDIGVRLSSYYFKREYSLEDQDFENYQSSNGV
jgi:phage gp29-like protein